MSKARGSTRSKSRGVSRKAALRNSPDWLDTLDLEDPHPPAPTPERSRTIAKNKAEEWHETLPDPDALAILKARLALDARKYEPAAPPAVPRITNLGPPRRREASPVREAVRNGAIFTLGALGIGYALSRLPHKGRQ